jgi:hypothetical protein
VLVVLDLQPPLEHLQVMILFFLQSLPQVGAVVDRIQAQQTQLLTMVETVVLVVAVE